MASRFTAALARAGMRTGASAIDVADTFGIGGFVRRHVCGAPPDHPATRLRGLYEAVLLEAAREMSAALDDAGIAHFFVKGVALAGRVYARGDRDMADADLFVPSAAATAAIEALGRIGFAPLPEREQSGPAALRPGIALLRSRATSELETVTADVHWGVEPIDRLLPRADVPVPARLWNGVGRGTTVPTPADVHHAALLIHHLAHHDLLHVRGLLDLALLWPDLPAGSGVELTAAAAELGALRLTRAVAAMLVRDLGLPALDGVGAPANDLLGRQLARVTRLDEWLAGACAAGARDWEAITGRRAVRRLLLVDRPQAALRLAADALFPPREHLRWRWPRARSSATAWACHLGSALRKLAAW